MRLYLGNLGFNTPVEEVYDLFVPFGPIISISIKSRFGFLEYDASANAQEAVTNLNGASVNGNEITVELCRDDRDGPELTTVYFVGLAEQTGWQQLQNHVADISEPIKTDTTDPDPNTGLRRGHVVFKTGEEATRCIQAFNNCELDGVHVKTFLGGKGRPIARNNGHNGSGSPQVDGSAPVPNPVRILYPSKYVGAIIGKGGANVRDISSSCGIKVDIQRSYGNQDRPITLLGSIEGICEALKKIITIVETEAESAGILEPEGDETREPLRLSIPTEYVGQIIGKGGAFITNLKATSQTSMTFLSDRDALGFVRPSLSRTLVITGPEDNLVAAYKLIVEKLQSVVQTSSSNFAAAPAVGANPGFPYTPQAAGFPGATNFSAPWMGQQGFSGSTRQAQERVLLLMDNSMVGAIIGRGGATIKDIRSQSNALVRVLTEEEDAKDGIAEPTERKVLIIGVPDSQAKAQQLIFHKLQESAINASGKFNNIPKCTMKLVIEFPAAAVGRMIGKGGSRIRDIMRVSGAIVEVRNHEKIGEEAEVDDETASLLITGDLSQSQAAQSLARQVLLEHSQNRKN